MLVVDHPRIIIRLPPPVERHLDGNGAVAVALLLVVLLLYPLLVVLLATLVPRVPGTVLPLPPAQDRAILFRGGGGHCRGGHRR